MTWAETKEAKAQWYAELAQEPGWFQYVKHSVIELEAETGGHWVGLRARWRELLLAAKFRPLPADLVEWSAGEIEATRASLRSDPPILGRLG